MVMFFQKEGFSHFSILLFLPILTLKNVNTVFATNLYQIRVNNEAKF